MYSINLLIVQNQKDGLKIKKKNLDTKNVFDEQTLTMEIKMFLQRKKNKNDNRLLLSVQSSCCELLQLFGE